MEMFSSMTMPGIFAAGLIVLALLAVGLYVAVRVAGGREARHDHPATPATDVKRDGGGTSPQG